MNAPAARPAINPDDVTDETGRWEAAAQVRSNYPKWVTIWSPLRGEFQARPLFRAPRGTVATGVTPDELTSRMDEIQQAAVRPKRTARA